VADRISFIVAARDELPSVLQFTIDGLFDTSVGHDREIVLVDDGSVVPVALSRPHLVVLRSATPAGVAQSRRYGASVASGNILVWLDAHMSFAPDWLSHMLDHVDSGALLCAAWWNYELTRPQCWGADFVWCGERDYHAHRTPGFRFKHRTQRPLEGVVEVPMVIGACYMMLRQSYEKFGGMSPFFRIWGIDEQDMSARAWITGIGVRCVTGACVGHLTRRSFPYLVSWDDIEFNQVAMVRTVFEEPVAAIIEGMLQPLPKRVEAWLAQTDFREWRRLVQSSRQISDAEFFRRFVPAAPQCLVQG
jgi:glycosyltransferase involved in cell wall biosynthesis